MIRPSSKSSSHTPESDDDIYSKIPDLPPSPTSPESMSIDMPLINNSESQNKVGMGQSLFQGFIMLIITQTLLKGN